MLSPSFRKYQNLPKSTAINQLMIQNAVTGCTVMVNRSLIEYMKRVRNIDAVVMHDYWVALIAEVFGKIVYIQRPMIQYRQHGNNSVGASDAAGVTYLWNRFKAGKKQFNTRLEETMIQIGYFCDVYKEELQYYPYKDILLEYANLKNVTRFRKWKFYVCHNVTKYGIIRKIMQFIWS